MGKVNENDLQNILEKGQAFLKNLRKKKIKKHETCKKCFGEPTKRGVVIRNLWNLMPSKFKRAVNFLNLTKY